MWIRLLWSSAFKNEHGVRVSYWQELMRSFEVLLYVGDRLMYALYQTVFFNGNQDTVTERFLFRRTRCLQFLHHSTAGHEDILYNESVVSVASYDSSLFFYHHRHHHCRMRAAMIARFRKGGRRSFTHIRVPVRLFDYLCSTALGVCYFADTVQ